MRYFVVLIMLLLILGCSNDQKLIGLDDESKVADGEKELHEAVEEIDLDAEESVVEMDNITFADYNVPSEFILQRDLAHYDTDITYFLHEFETKSSLLELDSWIRSESIRLGGTIIERYSYNIETDSNLDLIIEVPTKEGTRIISTYTQTYIDKQHLIIEETLFNEFEMIDENYEDHALVLFMPQKDGMTKEIFKGMYPHQHTDIFLYYFYTNAFFEELFTEDNNSYDMRRSEVDFLVGYFDKDGNEIDPYSITEETRNELTFGIQLQSEFLPEDYNEREAVLFHWAKTLLLGDKAYSRIFDGTEQVNFLLKGSVVKSYTLEDLVD